MFVAVHLFVVLTPLVVIAVWAFATAWSWPGLAPRGWTLRGVGLVLAGGQGAGLDCMLLSVGIALVSAGVSTLAATAAARAICRHRWRGRAAFRFAVLLPFLVPSSVFAMGVQVAFIRAGLAGTVGGVVLAHAVVSLPYAVAVMCDVTAAAGTRLEDAARTLGAGPLRAFAQVTLPLIAPGVVSSMSMCYIVSFSQYFLTLLVGSGRVNTFALVLFPYLSGGDRTVAGAYGLAFIVVTLLVFALFELLLHKLRVGEVRELYGV